MNANVVYYNDSQDKDAMRRFCALVGEPEPGADGGVGWSGINFEFCGDRCQITYPKVLLVPSDKAREFLGGVR